MREIPGNLRKEYDILKKEYEIDSTNKQKIINIADFFLDNKMYEYAIDEYLSTSLEQDSIYFKLGFCYIKTNKYNEAFECYCRCKTNDCMIGFIHDCFINMYNENSQIELAHIYNEIIKHYISKNKDSEIIKTLDEIEKYKLNDYTYFQLGQTLYKNNLYKLSIRCFTKSIELLDLDITRFFRSKAYTQLNDNDNALNDINKLLEENEEDLDYIYLKGKILLSKLEYKNSLNEFNKINVINDTFKDSMYLTALCLNELTQYKEAIKCIEKAIIQKKSKEKLELKTKIYYNIMKFDKTSE